MTSTMDAQRSPWWHNPWNTGALVVCLAFIGFAIGFAVGGAAAGSDDPSESSVDVGFLRDMSIHHGQAIGMSFILLDKDADTMQPVLRTIAGEIARGQQYEVGIMVEILADWGFQPQNEDEVVMRWMGTPLPEDQMPGMATDDQITQLRQATGAEADDLYTDLMIAHHQGGIGMADYAAEHASTARVRSLAASFARAQQGEINELQGLRP